MEEILSERTRTAKKYFIETLPDGRKRYAISASMQSIHYQDENEDWQEIDSTIVASDKPNWGGYNAIRKLSTVNHH